MKHDTLQRARAEAAAGSRGLSDAPIYQTIQRVVDESGASGSLLDYGAGQGVLARTLSTDDRFTSITAADLVEFDGRPVDSRVTGSGSV